MLRERRARVAWRFLESEFLGQSESRALLLEAEFRNFKQGTLSVGDYCTRLQTMATALADFGDPIGDRTMVLTLLRGLNEKFRHMVSILKLQRPFPNFDEARVHLQLEELELPDDSSEPSQAMVVSTPQQQQLARTPADASHQPGPSPSNSSNSRNNNNRRSC